MSKLKKEATHGYVGGPTYHKITDKQTGTVVAVNVREGYAELFEKSPELQEQVAELLRLAILVVESSDIGCGKTSYTVEDTDALEKLSTLAKHQEEK